MNKREQEEFNRMIGTLDNILSYLLVQSQDLGLTYVNKQTLKHHAEDIIGVGNKILERLK